MSVFVCAQRWMMMRNNTFGRTGFTQAQHTQTHSGQTAASKWWIVYGHTALFWPGCCCCTAHSETRKKSGVVVREEQYDLDQRGLLGLWQLTRTTPSCASRAGVKLLFGVFKIDDLKTHQEWKERERNKRGCITWTLIIPLLLYRAHQNSLLFPLNKNDDITDRFSIKRIGELKISEKKIDFPYSVIVI